MCEPKDDFEIHERPKGWVYTKQKSDNMGEIDNLIHGTEAVQKSINENFENN
jgi:hypothetical protein